MNEFDFNVFPEEQRQHAELEESMQSLVGVISYLTVRAPDDPAQEGRKAYTFPLDQDYDQLDSFTPFQHATSVTISLDKPEVDVEMRDNYIWAISFNTEGGITQLYTSPAQDSISIIVWAEEVDSAGYPIMPKGTVSLCSKHDGADIIPSADSTRYIDELARYLFDRIEPYTATK